MSARLIRYEVKSWTGKIVYIFAVDIDDLVLKIDRKFGEEFNPCEISIKE